MFKLFFLELILVLVCLNFCFARVPRRFSTSSYYKRRNNNSNHNFIQPNVSDSDSECKLSILPPNPKSQCCGVDLSSSNRIIGGQQTDLFQYPWMVLIEYDVKNTNKISTGCGGSLISGAYVLTAGHCVAGEILKTRIPNNVILGEHDRTNPGQDCIIKHGQKHCAPKAIKIKIARITTHEHYDDDNLENDIALIRLKNMAPYTDTIRPICLPTKDFTLTKQKQWLYVSGWGVMNQLPGKSIKNIASSVKRHVQLPFVPLKHCQEILPFVGPNQLCAGGVKGKDSCFGDSGGPLMRENEGIFEEVGIVSFGIGKVCARGNTPSIYTNVYKYLNWIKRHIEHF